MTAPLPAPARHTWRQDLLASLVDSDDGRGPIDFAIDVGLGMPRIVYREWLGARPGFVLWDGWEFSLTRAVRAGAAIAVALFGLLWLAGVDILVSAMLAGFLGIAEGTLLGVSRTEPAAERMRRLFMATPLGALCPVLPSSSRFAITAVVIVVSTVATVAIASGAKVPVAPAVAVAVGPIVIAGVLGGMPHNLWTAVGYGLAYGFMWGTAWTIGTGEAAAPVARVLHAVAGLSVLAPIMVAVDIPLTFELGALAAYTIAPSVIRLAECRRLVPLDAFELAMRLYGAGDSAGAVAALERAARFDGRRRTAATYHIAIALHDGGDAAGASAAYDIVIASDDAEYGAMASLNLGNLLRETEPVAAELSYRAAAESDDHFASAWGAFWLGTMLPQRGDLDGARGYLRIAASSEYTRTEAETELAKLDAPGRKRHHR